MRVEGNGVRVAMLGLPGFGVVTAREVGDELELVVQTDTELSSFPRERKRLG